ncbi:ABC transporter ATP-binding protein [Caenispirillum bisanense]|uniref:ABC transporter ATP-binding protein n=1 Tax=Caenispirillum bisanense TaxID=414052 RepID=UPI0031E41572
MTALLDVRSLRAGYGSINVLWDVDLTVQEGRTTVIVGPNGAGKTTLLRAMMGLVKTSSGAISLHGESLARTRTWDIVDRGVVMIPEGRMVFPDMSVLDNLLMGAYPRSGRPRWKQNLERVFDLFPRLRERRSQMAGSLSGGEAQMVAMGRGLMEEPKVLLIDEPSLGLAPVIVDEIFKILADLKAQGLTVVLVEQNTNRALALADDVNLMRSGKVLLSCPAPQVNLDRLHDLYFAREAV